MREEEYPTKTELKKIKNFVPKSPNWDWTEFFEFVKPIWKYSDMGYWTQKGRHYSISTGGWSGNEEIIDAMKSNFIFWSMCWQVHRRGGHFEFLAPIITQSKGGKKNAG